jgi:hypothetical protein
MNTTFGSAVYSFQIGIDDRPEANAPGGTSLTVETAIHGSAASSRDEILHAMDLYPTLVKIAGGELPEK